MEPCVSCRSTVPSVRPWLRGSDRKSIFQLGFSGAGTIPTLCQTWPPLQWFCRGKDTARPRVSIAGLIWINPFYPPIRILIGINGRELAIM